MSINAGQAVGYLDLDTSKFSNALKTAQAQLSTFNDKTMSAGEKFNSVGNGLKTIGSSLTKTVTVPLLAVGAASTKTAIDFESAFAGVKKTVDATDEELAKLEKGIRSMAKEMPQSASAIAEVAEAAGQLGIKTENVLDFTKTMVMLGDSTNMSADEAATSLARLANITGMSQNDFDKLGSTIVALGNNMATTESEITAMGLRLAGAGKQVGMSEAQVMSFASALSSVGIQAEAGGSAFSKVMINMQLATETGGKKLQQFAKVAGMSSSEFKKAFQEDASGAIIAFIKGLGDAEAQGKSAISILDDMGIKEVILRDTLLRAAGASDLFTEAIEIGTNAWDENTALTNEANQRYETLASKMEITKNKLQDVGITIGNALMPHFEKLVTKIGEVADWFGNLDSSTQGVILAISGILAVMGPALIIIGQMAIGIGALIGFFGTAKLAIMGFGTALKTNLLAVLVSVNTFISTTIIPALTTVATFITGTIIPALTATAFSVGAITVPVWAVIAVIGALIAVCVALYKNWDVVKAKCSEVWENSIKPIIETVTTAIGNFITATWQGILAFLSACWGIISTIALTIWNAIADGIKMVMLGIQLLITTVWNAIKTVITTVVNAIKTVITTVFNAIKVIITTVVNGWKNIITSVWNAIKSVVTSSANAIRSIISAVFNAIKSIIQTVANGWKNIIQTVWNGIKNVVSNGVNAVKSTISRVFSTIQSILTRPFEAAKSVISGILGGISSSISRVTSGIKNVLKLGRAMPNPAGYEENQGISLLSDDESNYSKVRFNYLRAKQVTLSDTLAKTKTMTDVLDSFKNNLKGLNKGSDSSDNNFTNTYNINLNIDKFVNEREQDVEQLMEEISFISKRQLSLG